MKFPFFASFLIFLAWFTYERKKADRIQQEKVNAFWARERKANFVRKKSLDNLPYIKYELSDFSLDLINDQPEYQDIVDTLTHLANESIVNFTGYTNTDLKLEYGTANITLLMQFDSNYTALVRTLQNLAELLNKKGYEEEAIKVLEFCIDTHTDISASYKLLASLYKKKQTPEKINNLIQVANSLKSVNKNSIVSYLEEQ